MWWLNLLLGALAAAGAHAVWDYDPISRPHAPWLLLAAVIAITERWPVNLQFQRSSHSFSLTDIPVTIALLFTSGAGAIGAILLGAGPAMLFRRLPPIKAVFNLVQFTLAIVVGELLVHSLGGAHPAFGPRIWAVTFVATQAGGVLTILLLAAVMFLADGSFTVQQLRQMFGMDLFVTAANTSLALIGTIILVKAPLGLPILVVPVLIGYAGYRAYVREHELHKKVAFLYQAHRSLAESPEVAVAVEGLLERAREAFRAERAEVILFHQDGSPPVRTRLGPGDTRDRLGVVDAEAAAALARLAAERPVALSGPMPAPVLALADGLAVRDAMVAVLRGEDRVIGTILLADRVGLTRGFGEDDLALFETLAANASAALQFDRLEHMVSELSDLQHRLHHQAYHDSLTGLANRPLFTQEVSAALRGEDGVSVLFIDLDDFKGVNDTLGHSVGDQLLCAAAGRIQRAVREGDLVARLGGDEFAVLVRAEPQLIDAVAAEIAQRIVTGFESPVAVAERLLSVRLSVGVATGSHSGRTTADLLRDADVAMYEAKSAGKRRFAVFTPAMRDAVMRRHALRDELESAIGSGELVVHYQPIIDLVSNRIAGVEALARWQHPTRGPIGPLEFIPLAEESSLIVPLGRHVLREACRQAVAWAAGPAPGVDVQVNLSARELEDPDLIPNVAATLADTGLPPERLTLEITETLLVRDAILGGATLDGLRALGVRLSLDDFGTGYSSLSYMRSLPLQQLKIAKEFVDAVTLTPDDQAFVRLIVELARIRGLSVVAEGIETPEQLAILRRIGCDRGQGYLFARPVPADSRELNAALLGAGEPGDGFVARPLERLGV